MNQVHFSSQKDTWATPQDFFDKLNNIHNFTLDVCAQPDSAKCPVYYTKEDDAFTKPWAGTIWMNPPYGRQIGKWMKRAYEASLTGAKVVCLVPARTDTNWWWEFARKGDIEFIRGRLKFGGVQTSAPFPSAVVVFNPPDWSDLFEGCAK
jgi:site-specific DNA-methyltransferase (adenine-specific)